MKVDDAFDVYSRLKGNTKLIKQYTNDILHLDRSTVEIKPDGSVVITPHPLPVLPNDIISNILSHLQHDPKMLHHCTLVNKVFYSLANPMLWKAHTELQRMNTERFFTSISAAPPQRLRTLLQHIPHLHLKNAHWTDAQLLRMLPHLSRLQSIDIKEQANITDLSFECLPYNCHQHLVYISLETPHLTRTSFDAIGQHCHQLTSIRWRLFQGQSPDWLASLTPSCPLSSLNLHGILSSSSSWDGSSLFVLKSWHHLTYLSIHFDNSPGHVKSLLEMASTTSDVWWPHLIDFRLGRCDDIDDTTLIGFYKSHPHIEHLTFDENNENNYNIDNNQFTDISIDAMALWLPKLVSVVLFNDVLRIYPRAMLRLIKQCHHLESVSICNPDILVSPDEVVDVEPNESNYIFGWLNRGAIDTIKQRESERQTIVI